MLMLKKPFPRLWSNIVQFGIDLCRVLGKPSLERILDVGRGVFEKLAQPISIVAAPLVHARLATTASL
jgi:hypothetical protein